MLERLRVGPPPPRLRRNPGCHGDTEAGSRPGEGAAEEGPAERWLLERLHVGRFEGREGSFDSLRSLGARTLAGWEERPFDSLRSLRARTLAGCVLFL